MSDIFHTLPYASTIRNSVTGPLTAFETGIVKVEIESQNTSIRRRWHGNVAQYFDRHIRRNLMYLYFDRFIF